MRACLLAMLLLLAFDAQALPQRVQSAELRRGAAVRAMFQTAGIAWPPAAIHLRVYKDDDVLELWGRGREERFTLVKSYPICARSGALGPKRKAGDGQVPEGLYVVNRRNPWSAFHLSLGIDYPNASDRLRGRAPFGGDIFIHGSCVTIGCVPIEDGPIEEVFLAAQAVPGRLDVHFFPARMEAKRLDALAGGDLALRAFWRELEPIDAAFVQTHRLPRVRIDKAGRYLLGK